MSSEFVALVTGANKGIGFEIVKRLCNHILTKRNGNGIVLMACRHPERGKQAVQKIRTIMESQTIAELLLMDVRDKVAIRAASRAVRAKYAGLDVLVNSAGIAFGPDEHHDKNVEYFETFDVNYWGVRNCMDMFFPMMKENGRVTILSSTAGNMCWSSTSEEIKNRIRKIQDIPSLDLFVKDLFELAASGDDLRARGFNDNAYANSKLLVTKLTRLYGKMATNGILVNCACPGWCKTDLGGCASAPKPASLGAQTPVLMCLLPAGAQRPQGELYSDGRSANYM